jgi:uncharacterized protein YjbI with pentapeptide repeats
LKFSAELVPQHWFLERSSLHGCELAINFLESWCHGMRVTGGVLENSNFTECDLTEARFEMVNFYNGVFDSCDLTGVVFDKCVLAATRFGDCEFGKGTDEETTVRPSVVDRSYVVELAGCRFGSRFVPKAVFTGAEMKHWNFRDCSLREADFRGVSLQGAVFERCDLRGAMFDLDVDRETQFIECERELQRCHSSST